VTIIGMVFIYRYFRKCCQVVGFSGVSTLGRVSIRVSVRIRVKFSSLVLINILLHMVPPKLHSSWYCKCGIWKKVSVHTAGHNIACTRLALGLGLGL